MSLVLVVARPPQPAAGEPLPVDSGSDAVAAAAGARTDVWRAVRHEVEAYRRVQAARAGAAVLPADLVAPATLDGLASAVGGDEEDPSVAYASSSGEAIEAVERRISEGATAVAVVPVALALDGAGAELRDPDLEALHRGLEELGRRHPEVELQYLGPPFHHAPALEAAIAALRPAGSDEPALLTGAVERAFGGDVERFGRFMSALQQGVPPGTRLVLRGSAVQGISYKTGEPFDARGPGTSDLDIVLLGDEAMAAWAPDAFYVPGVNTQPLYDDAPDVAEPALERARRAAQAVAGRPVAVQAMARWFLDLRSGLQGTPYVVLGG